MGRAELLGYVDELLAPPVSAEAVEAEPQLLHIAEAS
jgi:hypothetical protein